MRQPEHVARISRIATLPAATILAQCYQGGVQKFCQEIERDPASHAISHIVDVNQNVGTYLFKANLDTGMVDLTTGKEQIIHGRGYFDLGVQPDLKFNVFTTWRHPSGLGAGFNVRFVDSFQEYRFNSCNTPENPRRDVPEYGDGDVFVQYGHATRRGTTEVIAGVNNVANASPPVIYNGQGLNADASAYSFMGRQFCVRLAQRF